ILLHQVIYYTKPRSGIIWPVLCTVIRGKVHRSPHLCTERFRKLVARLCVSGKRMPVVAVDKLIGYSVRVFRISAIWISDFEVLFTFHPVILQPVDIGTWLPEYKPIHQRLIAIPGPWKVIAPTVVVIYFRTDRKFICHLGIDR